MNTALVTGTSSGIGLETARRLKQSGYRVFGTSRNPATNSEFETLALDVTRGDSARDCVERVLDATGRIDVLVNNAGYDLYAAAEETSDAELRAQMETNFFGAVRMTRLVAPLMRERTAGRIVQLSSVGGLFALPFNSAYAASKFALEGYSEALRHELLPFGVYVSLVEPGGVHTQSLETSVRLSREHHPAYSGLARAAADKLRAESRRAGLSTASVADAVLRAVNDPRPRLRYAVGGIATFMPVLKSLLPGTFEAMIRSRFPVSVNLEPSHGAAAHEVNQ
jgi:NAD(P)-dependent dehydrogenase (short-subunit alcohol dehydrogenase family)